MTTAVGRGPGVAGGLPVSVGGSTGPGSVSSGADDDLSDLGSSVPEFIDLNIVLPDGNVALINVESAKQMMDLLVQVAAANHLSPASHTISVTDPATGRPIHYKASQCIGSLPVDTIQLVPKGRPPAAAEASRAARRSSAPTTETPFERTQRLTVNLPRQQKALMRVSPRTTLAEIYQQVCAEKNLDPYKYELRHPTQPDLALNMAAPLADYHVTEINVVSATDCQPSGVSGERRVQSTPDPRWARPTPGPHPPPSGPPPSGPDMPRLKKDAPQDDGGYMPGMGDERKKKKGIFSLFSRKKGGKFNVAEASFSATPSTAAATPRAATRPKSQVPPQRPVTMVTTAAAPPNGAPSTASDPPTKPSRKKRHAPPPPPGQQVQSAPPPEPMVVDTSLSHSRGSSHSSGFEELSVSPLESPGGSSSMTHTVSKTHVTLDTSDVIANGHANSQSDERLQRRMSQQSVSSTGSGPSGRSRKKAPAPPPPPALVDGGASPRAPSRSSHHSSPTHSLGVAASPDYSLEGAASDDEDAQQLQQAVIEELKQEHPSEQQQEQEQLQQEQLQQEPQTPQHEEHAPTLLTTQIHSLEGSTSPEHSPEVSPIDVDDSSDVFVPLRPPCQFTPPPPPETPPSPVTPGTAHSVSTFLNNTSIQSQHDFPPTDQSNRSSPDQSMQEERSTQVHVTTRDSLCSEVSYYSDGEGEEVNPPGELMRTNSVSDEDISAPKEKSNIAAFVDQMSELTEHVIQEDPDPVTSPDPGYMSIEDSHVDSPSTVLHSTPKPDTTVQITSLRAARAAAPAAPKVLPDITSVHTTDSEASSLADYNINLDEIHGSSSEEEGPPFPSSMDGDVVLVRKKILPGIQLDFNVEDEFDRVGSGEKSPDNMANTLSAFDNIDNNNEQKQEPRVARVSFGETHTNRVNVQDSHGEMDFGSGEISFEPTDVEYVSPYEEPVYVHPEEEEEYQPATPPGEYHQTTVISVGNDDLVFVPPPDEYMNEVDHPSSPVAVDVRAPQNNTHAHHEPEPEQEPEFEQEPEYQQEPELEPVPEADDSYQYTITREYGLPTTDDSYHAPQREPSPPPSPTRKIVVKAEPAPKVSVTVKAAEPKMNAKVEVEKPKPKKEDEPSQSYNSLRAAQRSSPTPSKEPETIFIDKRAPLPVYNHPAGQRHQKPRVVQQRNGTKQEPVRVAPAPKAVPVETKRQSIYSIIAEQAKMSKNINAPSQSYLQKKYSIGEGDQVDTKPAAKVSTPAQKVVSPTRTTPASQAATPARTTPSRATLARVTPPPQTTPEENPNSRFFGVRPWSARPEVPEPEQAAPSGGHDQRSASQSSSAASTPIKDPGFPLTAEESEHILEEKSILQLSFDAQSQPRGTQQEVAPQSQAQVAPQSQPQVAPQYASTTALHESGGNNQDWHNRHYSSHMVLPQPREGETAELPRSYTTRQVKSIAAAEPRTQAGPRTQRVGGGYVNSALFKAGAGGAAQEGGKTTLKAQYGELQDQFSKWQRQLVHNQEVLVPKATAPPAHAEVRPVAVIDADIPTGAVSSVRKQLTMDTEQQQSVENYQRLSTARPFSQRGKEPAQRPMTPPPAPEQTRKVVTSKRQGFQGRTVPKSQSVDFVGKPGAQDLQEQIGRLRKSTSTDEPKCGVELGRIVSDDVTYSPQPRLTHSRSLGDDQVFGEPEYPTPPPPQFDDLSPPAPPPPKLPAPKALRLDAPGSLTQSSRFGTRLDAREELMLAIRSASVGDKLRKVSEP